MTALSLRRWIALGVLASLLTGTLLALFFLDIELPEQLHAFKLAALQRLKSTLGNVPADASPSGETGQSWNDDLGDDLEESVIVRPSDSTHLIAGNMPLTSSIQTTIPNGATIQGFTVFDNLVVHNGTFYIVTSNRSAFPENKKYFVDEPWAKQPVERAPSSEDFKFITPDELVPLLGDSAIRVDGFSWIMYDVPQFMTHYYHWWGEIILGGWRVYSRIGLDKGGVFHPDLLELPKRFMLPIVVDGKWRDKARVIGPFMRAAFNSAPIEERDQWLDFVRLNSTLIFDRALVTNRRSAHHHRWGGRWGKMIAGTMELEVATFDPTFDPRSISPEHEGFWAPIRKSLTMNLLGYIPAFESMTNRTVISPSAVKSDKPVVTYINRQKTGRRLTEESHRSLVEALRTLEEEGICEVQIVKMEDVELREQIRLVARSANGVNILEKWMVVNEPYVTVADSQYSENCADFGWCAWEWVDASIMDASIGTIDCNRDCVSRLYVAFHSDFCQTFVCSWQVAYGFDYEMLARNVGHRHYTVWNDTLITYKRGTYHKGIQILEGFHSSKIYVYGPAVAEKIKQRLLGIEGDDAETTYVE